MFLKFNLRSLKLLINNFLLKILSFQKLNSLNSQVNGHYFLGKSCLALFPIKIANCEQIKLIKNIPTNESNSKFSLCIILSGVLYDFFHLSVRFNLVCLFIELLEELKIFLSSLSKSFFNVCFSHSLQFLVKREIRGAFVLIR